MSKRGNLVLARRAGEAIILKVSIPKPIQELLRHINPHLLNPEEYETEIEVAVVEFINDRTQVRLAFDAPRENVTIIREELI
jgi:sRNA-binding carbon storage regulator CsrA